MSKFVLTAQLQLQAPRNTRQILNQIRSEFAGVKVPLEIDGATRANKVLKDTKKNLDAATKSSNRLAKTFIASTRRFLAFAAAGRALSLVTNNLSNAVSEAIDFERELIKISQVTGKTVKQLDGLNRSIKELSTTLGVSSTSILSVGRILSQAGFQARELEVALAALAKTELAPTFENIEQTAEGVVAIFNQFKRGAGELEAQLGAINAVAGQFAVESGDLISAVRRVGGVFESAGGDLNELIGLFTSIRATTRESAESIATGLRTIFTRIQRPKTIDFLKQFGVTLTDLEGRFVGPFEATKRLSAALSSLPKGSIEFVRIAEELGGFRQIGKVIPLLQQFEVAERARQAAIGGAGSLDKDAAKAQQSLAVQIQKVKEEFSALVREVVQSNTFQILAKGALSFAKAIIAIGDALKPILPLIGVLGAVKLTQGAFALGGGLAGALRGGVQGRNQGGPILGFNSGGLVPGVGNRDTVPAMLSPGEFVIKKSSTKKIGAGRLASLNSGGPVQYLANGGEAGSKTGIFDSDQIDSKALANELRELILQSKKAKELIWGPAGAGKTTLARQIYGENFVKSKEDLEKYDSFALLSGAQTTKGTTKVNGKDVPLSKATVDLIRKSDEITAIIPQQEELLRRRLQRIQDAKSTQAGGDTRSENQLKATLKAANAEESDKILELFKSIKRKKTKVNELRPEDIQYLAGGGTIDLNSGATAPFVKFKEETFNKASGAKFQRKPSGKKFATRFNPEDKVKFERDDVGIDLSAEGFDKRNPLFRKYTEAAFQGKAKLRGELFEELVGTLPGYDLAKTDNAAFDAKFGDLPTEIKSTQEKIKDTNINNKVRLALVEGRDTGKQFQEALTAKQLTTAANTIDVGAFRVVSDNTQVEIGEEEFNRLQERDKIGQKRLDQGTIFQKGKKFFTELGQQLNAGGIVDQNDLGAAILEAGGLESSSVKVSQEEVSKKLRFTGLARGASPVDRYFSGKSFGLQKQGLNKETSKRFSEALKAGFAAGTDNAVAAVAGDLGLPGSPIPESDIDNFYSGVRTSLIGDLFEATLRSFRDNGKFDSAEDPGRPFDFVGGLGAASDNFDSVGLLKYVDAKSTYAAASDAELKKKAINQIAFELEAAGIKDQPVGTKKALGNRGIDVPDLPGFPKRKGFAAGGPAGSDTVPAMLTPGEFVIKKSTAQKIGYGNLNRMNKQGVMGFAKGGPVPGVQYLQNAGPVGEGFTGPFAVFDGPVLEEIKVLNADLEADFVSLIEAVNLNRAEILQALTGIRDLINDGGIDAGTGEASSPPIFAIAEGSFVSLTDTTINSLSALIAEKQAAFAGIGENAVKASNLAVTPVGPISELETPEGAFGILSDTLESVSEKFKALKAAAQEAEEQGFKQLAESIRKEAKEVQDFGNAVKESGNDFIKGLQDRDKLQNKVGTVQGNEKIIERRFNRAKATRDNALSEREQIVAAVPAGDVISEKGFSAIIAQTQVAKEALAAAKEQQEQFKEQKEILKGIRDDENANDEKLQESLATLAKINDEQREQEEKAQDQKKVAGDCISLCPESLSNIGEGFDFSGFESPSDNKDSKDRVKQEESKQSDIARKKANQQAKSTTKSFGGLIASVAGLQFAFGSAAEGLANSENQFASAIGQTIGQIPKLGTEILGAGFAVEEFGKQIGADVGIKDLVFGGENNAGLQSLERAFTDQAENFAKGLKGFQNKRPGSLVGRSAGFIGDRVFKNSGKIAKFGKALTKAGGSALVYGKAASFLAKGLDNLDGTQAQLNESIKLGNVEAVKSLSVQAANQKAGTAFAASATAAGAAIGSIVPGVGTAFGALIGAVVGFGGKLLLATEAGQDFANGLRDTTAQLFGGDNTAILRARAVEQAQKNKTIKEESRNARVQKQAFRDIETGRRNISEAFASGDLTGDLKNQIAEQTATLNRIGEQRALNQSRQGEVFSRGFNNLTTFFGFSDSLETQDRGFSEEQRQATERIQTLIDGQSDLISDVLVSRFNAAGGSGGSFNLDTAVDEIANQLIGDDLSKKAAEGDLVAIEALNKAREQVRTFGETAIEAAKRQQEYIKSLNFGLREFGDRINSAAIGVSLITDIASGNATSFDVASARLSQSFTAGGGGLSDSELDSTVQTLTQSLKDAGASGEQIAKTTDQLTGFQTLFKRLNSTAPGFEKLKQELIAAGKAAGSSTGKGGVQSALDSLVTSLTEGLPEEVQSRVKSAFGRIESLSPEQLAKLQDGDASFVLDVIGEQAQKFVEELQGINQRRAEIERGIIASITARKAKEDELVAAQQRTIDLQKEAADVLDSIRPKALGKLAPQVIKARNERFARDRFNLGAAQTGGRLLRSGSAADIRASLASARSGGVNTINQTTGRIERGQGSTQGTAEQQDTTGRNQRNTEELLNFTRTRIQEEQKLIETIKERNQAEKSALESLLAGDIDSFIRQQEAAGAAAALETGDRSLAGLFDTTALGAGALELQKRGALTQEAAGLALGAFGIQDTQAAGVLSDRTPEIQAAQREIEGLARILPEFGKALEDIKKAEIETQTAIINAQRVELGRANQQAQTVTNNLDEELKKENQGAANATKDLASEVGKVGTLAKDAASELAAAVDKAANTSIGLTLNNPEALANIIKPGELSQKIAANVAPVVGNAIAQAVSNLYITDSGDLAFRPGGGPKDPG